LATGKDAAGSQLRATPFVKPQHVGIPATANI
jgi:hypothetical protein